MSFPLEQYLTGSNNRFNPEDYGLFSPERVSGMASVTPKDYRDHILDQLENTEYLMNLYFLFFFHFVDQTIQIEINIIFILYLNLFDLLHQ